MMPSLVLASSTAYGVALAASLMANNFHLAAVLTAKPQPQGRQQQVIPNAVQIWAAQKNVPIFLIEKKITPNLQTQLKTTDFLLVVDFGYYIPSWLIKKQQVAAINVHPSALPAYRGASPGQYVLLHGQLSSAVSFIKVSEQMDAGDVFSQIKFAVNPSWRSNDYYDFAFALAAKHLPQICQQIITGEITATAQQGVVSLAPKLSKKDAYISWQKFQLALKGQADQAITIERMVRAFYPWPLVWTIIPNSAKKKRLQLITCKLNNGKLLPISVKLAGKNTQPWQTIAATLPL